jgi:RNA polymerase sigma-70 factor (ECF subfamily)
MPRLAQRYRIVLTIAQLPLLHDNWRAQKYQERYAAIANLASMNVSSGIEAVFEASRPALRRFLRVRLRDVDEVEDALQELWMKLRTLDTGPIAEPLAYLYRMADNLALDRKRARGRRTVRETAWTEVQFGGTLQAPSDTAPSAERILIAPDYLQRVNRRIDALPERTAFTFRAVRIEGRARRDIAEELGISLSAVEKHLQRAYREIVAFGDELNADFGSAHHQSVKGTRDDK